MLGNNYPGRLVLLNWMQWLSGKNDTCVVGVADGVQIDAGLRLIAWCVALGIAVDLLLV